MKKSAHILSTAITLALLSTAANADSWDLTQTTTIDSNTTITQTNVTNQSLQALNTIKLPADTDILGLSSQTSTLIDDAQLTLQQDGASTNSTQAENYAKASTIGDTTNGAFQQQHIGTGNLVLKQLTTADGNTQGANIAEATTELLELNQTVLGANNIDLTQDVTGSGNVQAINSAKGKATFVDQLVEPVTNLIMNQKGTGDNKQFANQINAVGNTIGEATQTATSTTITMDQTTTGKGTQAINNASAMDITTKLDQSVTAEIGMTQNGVGSGSIQAGNYLLTTGDVESVSQDLYSGISTVGLTQNGVGSGSIQAANYLLTTGVITDVSQNLQSVAGVTLSQTAGGSNIVQAGNLLDASAADAEIINALQTVLADDLSLTQKNTTTGALQAANALFAGVTTGAAMQEVTVTTLTMLQTGTDGSIQAANYAGVAP